MADNVAITAGSGTTIATDDISGTHYQRVKLVDGTLDGTGAIPGDATYGLRVSQARRTIRISTQMTGLTAASTAYTAGDTLGVIKTLTGAVRVSGGSGIIRSIKVIDVADITAVITVFFFRSTVTLAADNAAWALSDADMLLYEGRFPISLTDEGNNRTGQIAPMWGFSCAASDLFMGLRTDVAHTFFGATTDITVVVEIEQD